MNKHKHLVNQKLGVGRCFSWVLLYSVVSLFTFNLKGIFAQRLVVVHNLQRFRHCLRNLFS